jgi:hypothetical protein
VSGSITCSAAAEQQSVSAGETILIPAGGLPAELAAKPAAVALEVLFD